MKESFKQTMKTEKSLNATMGKGKRSTINLNKKLGPRGSIDLQQPWEEEKSALSGNIGRDELENGLCD